MSLVFPLVNLYGGFESYIVSLAAGFLSIVGVEPIGLIVAALSPNLAVANSVAPMVTLAKIMVCGYFVVIDDIPVFLRWLSYISLPTYNFAIVMHQEFDGQQFVCTAEQVANKLCLYNNGAEVLAAQGIKHSVWVSFIVMAAMAVFWRFMAYFTLKLVTRNKTA